MKTWQKILIAVIGSGLFPVWSVVLGAFSVCVSGTMAILIGWPKVEKV